MLLMGKSTISTGPFSSSQTVNVYQAGQLDPYSYRYRTCESYQLSVGASSKKGRGKSQFFEHIHIPHIPSSKQTLCELENGPFISDLPVKKVIVHSYVNVYQRV